MPSINIHPGAVFGRLTVKSILGPYSVCICSCGVQRTVRNDRLRSGKTSSCGCYRAELRMAAKKPPKPKPAKKPPMHPLVKKLSAIHAAMVRRCTITADKSYPRYGGRGITVCDEWLNVDSFLFDMLPIYSEGRWLDRIDNDAGYSPDNCRWATPYQQSTNRSNTLVLAHGVSLPTWCRHHGVDYQAAYRAYSRARVRLGRTPCGSELEEELAGRDRREHSAN